MRGVNQETITSTLSWYKVQDLATQWIESYPCKTKTERSSSKFLEPSHKPQVMHTDYSLVIGKTCEDLARNYRTSTPHRSETNGIAERGVRRVKKILQQYCYNQELMKDGGPR